VVLVGAGLRFATLGTQSLWFDETVTGQLLRMHLGEMLRAIPGSESTPPLYYVIAWLWTRVAGTGAVGLRSLSAVFGTATIVVAWALGRRLAGDRGGLAAAALVAFNPLLIWFSQEARSYALLALLGALATLVWLRALEHGEGGRSARLAWGAIAAAALATHYFAIFLVAPQAIWLVVAAPDLRRQAIAVALPVAAGVALAPLAIVQQSDDRAAFIGTTALSTRLVHIPAQFLVGYYTPLTALAGALTVLVVVGGLAGLQRLVGARGAAPAAARADAVRVAVVAVSAVALPLIVAVAGKDYVLTRNVIAGLPLACVLLGAGLATFARRTSRRSRVGAAALALACLAGTITTVSVASDPRRQRDDWRDAARALGPITGPRLIVVTPVQARSPLRYYLPNARVDTAQGPTYLTAEIDEISLPARGDSQRAGSKPPRPRAPVAPAAGYALAGRTFGKTFTVLRWRAVSPRPAPIVPTRGLDGTDAALLTVDVRRAPRPAS
jgi:4-amino-4-deoxy-L-arabinose transferase-like glycosyltransferase